MSERKSINKYYPPDYDPSNLPKRKKQKGATPVVPTVRLMLPFSIKCLHCNEYMAHRRKFNARKEATGDDYLGIKIIKFTFRCPKCYAPLSFQTDPKNGDFECIEGCKKNYEKPKSITGEETVDDMIKRLEKDALEDEKLKDKSNKRKNQVTGVEELELRMIQQQKEREMFDEIELLQEESKNLQSVRGKIEKKMDIEKLNDKDDEDEAIDAFKKNTKRHTYTDSMLETLIKTQESKPKIIGDTKPKLNTETNKPGLSLGYSSSEED